MKFNSNFNPNFIAQLNERNDPNENFMNPVFTYIFT